MAIKPCKDQFPLTRTLDQFYQSVVNALENPPTIRDNRVVMDVEWRIPTGIVYTYWLDVVSEILATHGYTTRLEPELTGISFAQPFYSGTLIAWTRPTKFSIINDSYTIEIES